MNKLSLMVLSLPLIVFGSAVQASECTTVMSFQDPGPSRPGLTCKRVARNSTNGMGVWRCCPET